MHVTNETFNTAEDDDGPITTIEDGQVFGLFGKRISFDDNDNYDFLWLVGWSRLNSLTIGGIDKLVSARILVVNSFPTSDGLLIKSHENLHFQCLIVQVPISQFCMLSHLRVPSPPSSVPHPLHYSCVSAGSYTFVASG